MNKIALKSIAMSAIVAATAIASAQSANVSFNPNKPRYARGEQMTVVVVARNSFGQRVANAPVWIYEYVSSLGQYKGSWFGYSNSIGEVRVPYRVPTNPLWDNVYIESYAYTSGWGYGSLRVPIGR